MSKAFSKYPSIKGELEFDILPMAIQSMGVRHCCYGLFYKIDRSQSFSKYSRCRCEEVYLEEHHKHIQGPQNTDSNNGLQFDNKTF